ncbi:recombinase family protein [Carbonactinospora thermoautotrophica]|uniref:recombinase family protein n=1 Tax=Carbonactinospora thermoautotrophica TaxID=1469144 RepID=UPI003DA9DEE6
MYLPAFDSQLGSGRLAEQRLTEFVDSRGWQLTGVFRDHGIVTLADAGPALEQILSMLSHGQIKGMVTLASYTISWDLEVVRHIEQRIAQLGGFVTYLYGAAGQPAGVPRQGG